MGGVGENVKLDNKSVTNLLKEKKCCSQSCYHDYSNFSLYLAFLLFYLLILFFNTNLSDFFPLLIP